MTTDDVEHVVHAVDSRPQHLLVAVYFHCFNKLAMLCRRFGPVATRITLSFHALCGQRQCVCVATFLSVRQGHCAAASFSSRQEIVVCGTTCVG